MSEGGITAENQIGVQNSEDSSQSEIVPAQQIEPVQSPKLEEDEATHETAEREKAFSEYADKRLADGVINASDFGRELPPERSAEYGLEIKKASLYLIDNLGIDESLFADGRNSEAFLALADSWAANENSQTPNNAERTFLLQFSRILAGNKASYNKEAFQRGEVGADKYFDDPSSELAKKDKADFDKLLANVQAEKTAALEAQIADFGEGSILAGVRANLGITSADQEKPFRVMVLNTRRNGPKEGEKDWKDVVGGDAIGFGAFMTNNPEDKVPTMVMSQEEYDDLSFNDTSWLRKDAVSLIGHEYGHTQRQMRLGKDTALGRIFDERMVVLASDGGLTHMDTAVVLKTMAETLGPTDPDFRAEFKKAALSPQNIEDFFRLVSDKFGLRSTLTLLATPPKSYRELYDGLNQIPGVRSDPDSRISDLIKIVVAERAKIDPHSIDSYKARLSFLEPEQANDILIGHNMAKAFLPTELESIVEARAKTAASN